MVCDYLEGIMIMSKVWIITGTRSGIGAKNANAALQAAGHHVSGAIGFKGAAVYSDEVRKGFGPKQLQENIGGKNAKA